MGDMGSDEIIEAADIVLMDDDQIKISKAIKISKNVCELYIKILLWHLVLNWLV